MIIGARYLFGALRLDSLHTVLKAELPLEEPLAHVVARRRNGECLERLLVVLAEFQHAVRALLEQAVRVPFIHASSLLLVRSSILAWPPPPLSSCSKRPDFLMSPHSLCASSLVHVFLFQFVCKTSAGAAIIEMNDYTLE